MRMRFVNSAEPSRSIAASRNTPRLSLKQPRQLKRSSDRHALQSKHGENVQRDLVAGTHAVHIPMHTDPQEVRTKRQRLFAICAKPFPNNFFAIIRASDELT